MKRLALLFILAVMIPCCVLAWFAQRAMVEEQNTFKRQHIALAQEKTDALASNVRSALDDQLEKFKQIVDEMVEKEGPDPSKHQFDQMIRSRWSMAQIGFVWQEQEGLIQPPQTPGDARVEYFLKRNPEFSQEPQLNLADASKLNRFTTSRFSGGAGAVGGALAAKPSDSSEVNSQFGSDAAHNEIKALADDQKKLEKFLGMKRPDEVAVTKIATDKKMANELNLPAEPERDEKGKASVASRSRVVGEPPHSEAAKFDAPLPPLNAPSLPEGKTGTLKDDELQKLKLSGRVAAPAKPVAAMKSGPVERPTPPQAPAPTSAPLSVSEPAPAPAADVALGAAMPPPAPIAAANPIDRSAARDKSSKLKADSVAVDKLLEATPGEKQSLADLTKFETNGVADLSDIREERGLDDKPVEGEALFKKLKSVELEVQEKQKTQVGVELRTVTPENLSREQQASLGRISLVPQQADSLMNLWKINRSGTTGRIAPTGDFSLIVWYRPTHSPGTVFGAQLDEPKLHEILTGLIQGKRPAEEEGICLTILNASGKPVSLTKENFSADWQRPYVSTEIGSILPKWEAACYLLAPDSLLLSARAAQWKLGLMVLAVLAAALVGAALLWMEARRRWQEARLKSDFVSQVSHELKTPLTSIRMFSDLLVTNAPSPDPVKTQKYAEVISQEAGRLSRLINSVLDFSRLERGDLPMQCQSEKLNRIVHEVVEHYRPHLESLGFQLNLHLPEQEVSVHADADRLSQVLLNLLCNAEKYSGEGREIDVTLDAPTNRLATLTVADRGPGVPAGKEKRIFEKFYRAHDSLNSGIPGTGLGLALARQIARAHQGDLTYKRRPGGGSQFSLTIPVIAEVS